MKTSYRLMWVLCAFFVVAAVLYTGWHYFYATTGVATVTPGEMGGRIEWVGALGLILCASLFGLIGYYLGKSYKAQGAELPEDLLDSNIDDGDPEVGFYSPWSWWPMILAAGAALVFLGVAIGPWIAFLGAAVTALALVGWTYEYYRGYFGR